MRTFADVGDEKRRLIAIEIAMLGRSGFDINTSVEQYTLKSLPGRFSGLHLLAIMCAAFKQIETTLESGADFSAEYEAARQMKKS